MGKSKKNTKRRNRKSIKTAEHSEKKTVKNILRVDESEKKFIFDEHGTVESSQESFIESCRVCLTNNICSMFPLTSNVIAEDYSLCVVDALETLIRKKIKKSEELPAFVCAVCLETILTAYVLILRYEESSVTLEERCKSLEPYDIEYLDDDSNASDSFKFNKDTSTQKESLEEVNENEQRLAKEDDSNYQIVCNADACMQDEPVLVINENESISTKGDTSDQLIESYIDVSMQNESSQGIIENINTSVNVGPNDQVFCNVDACTQNEILHLNNENYDISSKENGSDDIIECYIESSMENESSQEINKNMDTCTKEENSNNQTAVQEEIWVDWDTAQEVEYVDNECIINNDLLGTDKYILLVQENEESISEICIPVIEDNGFKHTLQVDPIDLSIQNKVTTVKINNLDRPINRTQKNVFFTNNNDLNGELIMNKESSLALHKENELQTLDDKITEDKLTSAIENDMNEFVIINKNNKISNVEDVSKPFETRVQNEYFASQIPNNLSVEVPLSTPNEESVYGINDSNVSMLHMTNGDSVLKLTEVKQEPLDDYETNEQRINCRTCKVTMLKSEITSHMIRCKMKKENPTESDTKLKLIICKHCKALLYLNDMVQHSTNCKKLLEETLRKISASPLELLQDDSNSNITTNHSLNQVDDSTGASDIIVDPTSAITFRKIDNISQKRNISNTLTLHTTAKSSRILRSSLGHQNEKVHDSNKIIKNGPKKSISKVNKAAESHKKTGNIEVRKRNHEEYSDIQDNRRKRKRNDIVQDFVEVCNTCNEIFTDPSKFRKHKDKHDPTLY